MNSSEVFLGGLAIAVCVSAAYTMFKYAWTEKRYHDLFMAIHSYNCDKIAAGDETSVISYEVLADFPSCFASRIEHKRYISSKGLDRLAPYLNWRELRGSRKQQQSKQH